jgi:hypothetical protein
VISECHIERKGGNAGNILLLTFRHSISAKGVQLPDFRCRPALTCVVKGANCHAGLDEPRAERVDTDVSAGELVHGRLSN